MTEADWLERITDDPTDIAARLAFSDWLEENAGMIECSRQPEIRRLTDLLQCGEQCPACHGTGSVDDGRMARAEFIRCQVELERMGELPHHSCRVDDDDHSECQVCEPFVIRKKRSRELLSEWGHIWFRDSMPGIGKPPEAAYAQWWSKLRRGFIETVECSAAIWQEHGPEIVRACPVREVRLPQVLATGMSWCSVTDMSLCVCADSKTAIAWARADTRDGELREMPVLSGSNK